MTKKCKCGTEIEFVNVDGSGKLIPLEVRHVDGYAKIGHVYQKLRVRLNHFVTCPHRDEFRRKRK